MTACVAIQSYNFLTIGDLTCDLPLFAFSTAVGLPLKQYKACSVNKGELTDATVINLHSNGCDLLCVVDHLMMRIELRTKRRFKQWTINPIRELELYS